MNPIVSVFAASPNRGRGLARDMAVRWALAEVGQDHQLRLLSFADLKTPEHKARQSVGQIPTVETDGLTLFESGAIVLHIAETHGLLPVDPAARARAIAWMVAAVSTLEPVIVEREVAVLLEGDKPWTAERLPMLEEKERASSRQLDIVLRNQSQGAELEEQLLELKRLTAGMNGRLMVVEQKAQNLQFFYDIESRSRATINELTQGGVDVGDAVLRPKLTEFTGMSFNLTLSGRIGYIMTFLKRLESGKYFVRCNSALLKGNKTLAPDAVDVVLKLEVLTQKP